MSEIGPFGAGGPFGELMRNLAQMLTTQGPLNWDIAKQLAQWAAVGGQPETNVDPVSRVRLEEMLRIAELHISDATGLELSTKGMLTVRAVTRSEWALRSLEAWRPLLERLAERMKGIDLGGAEEADQPPGAGGDPMAQLFGNLPQVLGPLMFGMQAGSMVGQLAQRAMGQYDLPMPRPPS
ncbi:MAG: zinc-dependent metalloprotease, partial [Acidimicrobiales bacterium]